MPGGDGTGPLGKGPYTGRCINRGARFNSRRRPFIGRGLNRGFYTAPYKEDLEEEKKVLEERINYINSQLESK